MRLILITLMIALMAVPAQARMRGKRGAVQQQSDLLKRKRASEEERAAKTAIEKLPDKPYDPWRNAR